MSISKGWSKKRRQNVKTHDDLIYIQECLAVVSAPESWSLLSALLLTIPDFLRRQCSGLWTPRIWNPQNNFPPKVQTIIILHLKQTLTCVRVKGGERKKFILFSNMDVLNGSTLKYFRVKVIEPWGWLVSEHVYVLLWWLKLDFQSK